MASTEQRFKYNQGFGEKTFNTERISDLGLNWDMTKFRMYDYSIGRFLQVDPLADIEVNYRWSPYSYSFNNPVRYNDPYGDCVGGDCPPQDRTEATATVSVGGALGISAKVAGLNLSLRLDIGSLEVINFTEETGMVTKSGFDVGLGPVGVSSTSEQDVTGSTITETNESSINVFNLTDTGSETTTTTDAGRPNAKSTKTKDSKSSIDFGLTLSAGVTIDLGFSVISNPCTDCVGEQDKTKVASDETNRYSSNEDAAIFDQYMSERRSKAEKLLGGN